MDVFDFCKNDPEEFKRLVEKGADVNMTNYVNGNTLLHRACWKQPSVVEFLIRKGANVNAKNYYGHTPLHWAESRHVIELLLKHGADINTVDNFGETPLDAVCIDYKLEAVRTLYEHGSRLPSERYKELDKVIALYAGMCWKRSRVGGLSSHILISYLV
jgi:hypothetical protein